MTTTPLTDLLEPILSNYYLVAVADDGVLESLKADLCRALSEAEGAGLFGHDLWEPPKIKFQGLRGNVVHIEWCPTVRSVLERETLYLKEVTAKVRK